MMKNYPLSCFTEAAKTTTSGVLAFVAGLIGGTIIADLQSYHTAGSLLLCFMLWPLLIFYTLAHVWGLLLLPFLAVMLYGLVWRDWNRLVGAGFIAIASATTWALCKKHNPFSNMTDGVNFTVSIAVALGFIVVGVLIADRGIRQHPVAD